MQEVSPVTKNEERQPLAMLSDEAADAWGRYAADNDVTIDGLLEALAPILLASTPANLSMRSALREAVEAARSISQPLSA